MKNTNLGFDKEQKLVIPLSAGKDYNALKNEFLKYPYINGATASNSFPGQGTNSNGVQLPNADNVREQVMDHMYVDFDFFKEFKIELAAGRFYAQEYSTDVEGPFILNEAAVKAFGWSSSDDAVGQIMMSYYDSKYEKHPIIGVVKDFNFEGLQVKIKPLVMILAPIRFRQITLSLNRDNISGTLSFVRNKWEELNPNDVFSYFFVDEEFNRHYRTEEHLMKIFGVFAAISIFISCLGLFGLAAFMTEKRSKEIGVRKVLGATEPAILLLFSKEFSKWVILANIFAWPIGFYVMNRWLQNFAFRIRLDIWSFALSGGVVFLIALLSISYQSLKAALADPIASLRYE
jgi:putative ABC transport system permease protein